MFVNFIFVVMYALALIDNLQSFRQAYEIDKLV